MSIAVNHAVLAKGRARFTIMLKDRKVAAVRFATCPLCRYTIKKSTDCRGSVRTASQ